MNVNHLDIHVRPMTSLEVRPLRLEVLRAGMVNQTVHFDGDDDPTTIHLGAFDQDQNNVGVSTWMQRPFPLAEEHKALQLRGMATAVNVQGKGIGALLLVTGQSHGREIGAHLIWANARDAALNFYNRHGYSTVGEGFIETVTQLPHHKVVKYLVG
jgi:predicted GNAT family N-acyltransferase